MRIAFSSVSSGGCPEPIGALKAAVLTTHSGPRPPTPVATLLGKFRRNSTISGRVKNTRRFFLADYPHRRRVTSERRMPGGYSVTKTEYRCECGQLLPWPERAETPPRCPGCGRSAPADPPDIEPETNSLLELSRARSRLEHLDSLLQSRRIDSERFETETRRVLDRVVRMISTMKRSGESKTHSRSKDDRTTNGEPGNDK